MRGKLPVFLKQAVDGKRLPAHISILIFLLQRFCSLKPHLSASDVLRRRRAACRIEAGKPFPRDIAAVSEEKFPIGKIPVFPKHTDAPFPRVRLRVLRMPPDFRAEEGGQREYASVPVPSHAESGFPEILYKIVKAADGFHLLFTSMPKRFTPGHTSNLPRHCSRRIYKPSEPPQPASSVTASSSSRRASRYLSTLFSKSQ